MYLKTERLLLREMQRSDGEFLYGYSQHPEVRRYEADLPVTADEFMTIVDWMIRSQQDKPRTYTYLAITLADDPTTPIGSIHLSIDDHRHRQAETGYILGYPYWRQGYTTEAVQAILRYGFETLALHRIFGADIIHENIASIRVLEKVGMRQEAYFREARYFEDRWWDTITMAILRDEWAAHDN